jgi:cytochrome c oxidase subunit 2
MVLAGQTAAYTLYVLVMIALMSRFAYKVTKVEEPKEMRPAVFYSFVGFLVVLGVSLHIITYNTIPWAPLDLNRASIQADRVFEIQVADHKFHLPAEKLMIKVGEKVLFKVTSDDLTYGFGLFRSDHSMVFQMQVMPGHMNDILWHFDRPGIYIYSFNRIFGSRGRGDVAQRRC